MELRAAFVMWKAHEMVAAEVSTIFESFLEVAKPVQLDEARRVATSFFKEMAGLCWCMALSQPNIVVRLATIGHQFDEAWMQRCPMSSR